MRIYIRLVTMSGPPRVSNANEVIMLALALVTQPLNAIATVPITGCKFMDLELSCFVVDRHETARVVPARLQNLEPIHANLSGNGVVANVSNNTATFILHLGLFGLIIHEPHHGHRDEQTMAAKYPPRWRDELFHHIHSGDAADSLGQEVCHHPLVEDGSEGGVEGGLLQACS